MDGRRSRLITHRGRPFEAEFLHSVQKGASSDVEIGGPLGLEPGAVLVHEMFDQWRDVVGAFAQVRHADRDDREAASRCTRTLISNELGDLRRSRERPR